VTLTFDFEHYFRIFEIFDKKIVYNLKTASEIFLSYNITTHTQTRTLRPSSIHDDTRRAIGGTTD